VTGGFLTTTRLTARPISANGGRRVTLTATIKISGRQQGVPGVQVTFLDGASIPVVMSLARGRARPVVSSLPLGPDPIQIRDAGGPNFAASSQWPQAAELRWPVAKRVGGQTLGEYPARPGGEEAVERHDARSPLHWPCALGSTLARFGPTTRMALA
jgi:hypothetical protein